ncbi:MAG TPA: DUF3822 family protein [Chryseosolibacter sp.]|nr:DUF3822 family protein [Chryseosolibacter sp.]
MQPTALNYKLIKKIKDERFDVDHINQYTLLLHVGPRDLQVGVVDSTESKMLLLEDFVFPSLSSQEELLEILEQLFDEHALLKAAFWRKVKVSIKNNKFVQVPEALFVEESQAEYLRFNARVDEDNEYVQSVLNPKSRAVTVFTFPKVLRDWFTTLYPGTNLTFLHQSAVLIEGITRVSELRKDNPLYIYVDRFRLHIVSARQGQLIYYNQFVIKQFSEYVKYIMLVMKTLNYSQENSQVVLWGYIGKNSPHYNEFYKYIKNVVFGYRPKHLKFGYLFDEVQDHHFFDLYCMHLIGNLPAQG